jgi:hypothetical protein
MKVRPASGCGQEGSLRAVSRFMGRVDGGGNPLSAHERSAVEILRIRNANAI